MSKTVVKDNTYFSVQAWMVTKLKLKGVERDIYAIIYGYSQDNESDFHGSLNYLSQLTGYTKNGICKALKSLVDKGLISKQDEIVNNIKYCRYRTTELHTIQLSCTENEESVQLSCTNNKQLISKDISNIDNKIDNKEIEWFLKNYHSICVSLPKVMKLSEKRKKAIRKILDTFSKDNILECFELAEQSDFLKGNNERGWKADIDFILREDKFINIVEGKYGGRKKTRNTANSIEHLYEGLNKQADKKGGNNGTAKF